LPAQAVPIAVGVQTHAPAVLHMLGAAQVPHDMFPVHPSETEPQALPPQAVDMVIGVQAQAPEALQVLGAVQVPQV
jgi:hypothetical protein